MTINELEHVDIKHPLHLSHAYRATPSSVFKAWTTPSLAAQWLFKNETNQISFEIDLQEGGEFSVMEYDQGKTIAHFGEYLKISKPNVLVFTLAVPDHFEGVSVVRVDIEDSGNGCTLTLTQTNIDTTRTIEAWESMLTRLEMVLEDHNIPFKAEHSTNDEY